MWLEGSSPFRGTIYPSDGMVDIIALEAMPKIVGCGFKSHLGYYEEIYYTIWTSCN